MYEDTPNHCRHKFTLTSSLCFRLDGQDLMLNSIWYVIFDNFEFLDFSWISWFLKDNDDIWCCFFVFRCTAAQKRAHARASWAALALCFAFACCIYWSYCLDLEFLSDSRYTVLIFAHEWDPRAQRDIEMRLARRRAASSRKRLIDDIEKFFVESQPMPNIPRQKHVWDGLEEQFVAPTWDVCINLVVNVM